MEKMKCWRCGAELFIRPDTGTCFHCGYEQDKNLVQKVWIAKARQEIEGGNPKTYGNYKNYRKKRWSMED